MQPKFAIFALVFILLLAACQPSTPTAAPIPTAPPTPAPTPTDEPIVIPADIQALIAQNAAQSAGTQKAEWHLLSGTDPEPVGAAIPRPDDPTQSEFKLVAANGEFITGVSAVNVVYSNDKAAGLLAHTDSGLFFENGADGKTEWQPLAFSPAAQERNPQDWNFVVDEAGNQFLVNPKNDTEKLIKLGNEFVTQAEYIKATFSIDEWKSLDDSARAQWFEKNAADLGIKFSEWDKWQVLGKTGLVRLQNSSGEMEYFDIFSLEFVTDQVWTFDRYDKNLIQDNYYIGDSGKKMNSHDVIHNTNKRTIYENPDPEVIKSIPEGTQIIILHLDGGHITIHSTPKQAAIYAQEGATIIAENEPGIKAKSLDTVILRTLKTYWETKSGRDITAEFGKTSDPNERGTMANLYYANKDFYVELNSQGQFTCPYFKMPQTKYLFKSRVDDSIIDPATLPPLEDPTLWLDPAFRLNNVSIMYPMIVYVYFNESQP